MYFLYRQNQRSAPERAKAKVPKSSAHGKNLHKRPLLRPHNVSLRSVVCSSLQAFGCFQGAAKLVPHGCIRKITAMLHSNILTQWPENNRPCVGFFNGAVLWILPLLMEIRELWQQCRDTAAVSAKRTRNPRTMSCRQSVCDETSLYGSPLRQCRNGDYKSQFQHPWVAIQGDGHKCEILYVWVN